MIITLEIPDSLIEEGRMMHVMAGRERMAFKPWLGKWRVKVSRCSKCGKCCEKAGCLYLEANKECGMKANELLFRCCVNEPSRIESCTSRYREVE